MEIKITVVDKVATVEDNAKIVCGNSDYQILFEFDDEWEDHDIKTARFKYTKYGKVFYFDMVFNGDICQVPVLTDILEVSIGVYAGDLSTTTPAVVNCEKSILCGSPVHEEPQEDVYNQLIELIGNINNGVGRGNPQGGAIFNDYDTNIAGGVRYYYSHIDTLNRKIYLHTEQTTPTASEQGQEIDYNFGDTGYEVGQQFSITNGLNGYDNCGIIEAIEGNCITVSELPFTEIVNPYEFKITDFTFYVLGVTEVNNQYAYNMLNAFAEGSGNKSEGYISHSEGLQNISSGVASHSENKLNKASGNYSHAEGHQTFAEAEASHSEGAKTEAKGINSHAEGGQTTAEGQNSHSEGYGTQATGDNSHAEGNSSMATEDNAHAEGNYTNAHGKNSHSEGSMTQANGKNAHAEGYYSQANGEHSHAEGRSTVATGNHSHSEGYASVANGESSHAEGYKNKANGEHSHAEGDTNEANGDFSHAEGKKNKAVGESSHAEGCENEASGKYSHAEGKQNIASGKYSHAGGNGNTASHANSFTHGSNLRTSCENQTVFGSNNADEPDAMFIVGNGSDSNARSNALVSFKDGHLEVGNTSTNNMAVVTYAQMMDEISRLRSGIEDLIRRVTALEQRSN